MEFTILVLGIGAVVSTVRIIISKQGKKSKKLVYFNYRKYAIRHKQMNEEINLQSKNRF